MYILTYVENPRTTLQSRRSCATWNLVRFVSFPSLFTVSVDTTFLCEPLRRNARRVLNTVDWHIWFFVCVSAKVLSTCCCSGYTLHGLNAPRIASTSLSPSIFVNTRTHIRTVADNDRHVNCPHQSIAYILFHLINSFNYALYCVGHIVGEKGTALNCDETFPLLN